MSVATTDNPRSRSAFARATPSQLYRDRGVPAFSRSIPPPVMIPPSIYHSEPTTPAHRHPPYRKPSFITPWRMQRQDTTIGLNAAYGKITLLIGYMDMYDGLIQPPHTTNRDDLLQRLRGAFSATRFARGPDRLESTAQPIDNIMLLSPPTPVEALDCMADVIAVMLTYIVENHIAYVNVLADVRELLEEAEDLACTWLDLLVLHDTSIGEDDDCAEAAEILVRMRHHRTISPAELHGAECAAAARSLLERAKVMYHALLVR